NLRFAQGVNSSLRLTRIRGYVPIKPYFTTPLAIRDGYRNLQFRDVQTDKKPVMLIHGSPSLSLGLGFGQSEATPDLSLSRG
ncbi:hypothetical protein, partial [Sinorhizobium meliloti]|uniref:hypothetical protein n=1 Tax=Rhizobium meliloti TaxID=382 RepID=UPI001AEF193C